MSVVKGVKNTVQQGADAATSDAGTILRRAQARAGQMDQRQDAGSKESATDVLRHARDGYQKQREELGMSNPLVPPLAVELARLGGGMMSGAKGLKAGLTSGVHSSEIGETGSQLIDQLGKDVDNLRKADGALQTAGAVFSLMTSAEQLVSTPFAKIPFPAFPALRVGDYDVGLPHGHMHPPNLVPPAPMLLLPSTGPVIPIPFVSGANKTLINGMPAARCGDLGLGVWCGGYVPLYEVVLGSASVWVEGARAARMGVDITNHCIFSARKGPDDKPVGAFVGFTINGSPNVVIGGAPMPSLTSMAIGAAMRPIFKGAGRVISALRARKAASLADKVAEQANKADEAADTVPDMPASRLDDAADTAPDMPAATKLDDSVQHMDMLDIFLNEFSDEVRNLVKLSPTLSDQLRRLHGQGWSANRGTAAGHCDRPGKRLVIQEGPQMDEVGSLAHEGGHGLNTPPPDIPKQGLSEGEFVARDVDGRMMDEGQAQFNEAKALDEIRSNGGPDGRISGNHSDDYDEIYQRHKDGHITKEQAEREMADRMRSEQTGNTGEEYLDYYAKDARRRYKEP